jgi:hypothetical protein
MGKPQVNRREILPSLNWATDVAERCECSTEPGTTPGKTEFEVVSCHLEAVPVTPRYSERSRYMQLFGE